MKSIVAILVTLGLSLTLSAVEPDDTFNEWDMIMKGCIEHAIEHERYLGKKASKITDKVNKGIELTCQEKVILILEAQKFVRETVRIIDMQESDLTVNPRKTDKEALAWLMVRDDSRLKELKNMKTRTGTESLELGAYYHRITKALKLFFPECYTDE